MQVAELILLSLLKHTVTAAHCKTAHIFQLCMPTDLWSWEVNISDMYLLDYFEGIIEMNRDKDELKMKWGNQF